jgi:hypothetical protein
MAAPPVKNSGDELIMVAIYELDRSSSLGTSEDINDVFEFLCSCNPRAEVTQEGQSSTCRHAIAISNLKWHPHLPGPTTDGQHALSLLQRYRLQHQQNLQHKTQRQLWQESTPARQF